jgi:hypothetical protein
MLEAHIVGHVWINKLWIMNPVDLRLHLLEGLHCYCDMRDAFGERRRTCDHMGKVLKVDSES